MKCSICKSGTHLTASCASTAWSFFSRLSSAVTAPLNILGVKCLFLRRIHTFIKVRVRSRQRYSRSLTVKSDQFFFKRRKRQRERVSSFEGWEEVRRQTWKKESSESERHMGSSAHHCNSHNTQLSHAQAANVSRLLKKGAVCLYSHPAISICDRPRLALFLCAKHFTRDNSRQHTSCLDGKLGKYNADCVAPTVTLLVGNISFKCECPPLCLLFNGAETKAER